MAKTIQASKGTPAILFKLARSLQPWCTKCGSTKDLTADHILSIAQGGLNTLDNISVLCRKCNSSKK